jgi:hypothetical protein
LRLGTFGTSEFILKKTVGEKSSPAVFFCKKTGIMASIHGESGLENQQQNKCRFKKIKRFSKAEIL